MVFKFIREEHRLRRGCLEEYLDPRGRKQREAGKKLHNEELHNLYSPKYYYGSQIEDDETVRDVARMEKLKNEYKM
jgi:hypothetical protein